MFSFFSMSTLYILIPPFFGTVILTGLIYITERKGSGGILANASVGISFAWFCAFIIGTPDFPPQFNSSGILSAIVSLIIIGAILDFCLHKNIKFQRFAKVITLVVSGFGATIWMRNGIDLWLIPYVTCWCVVMFSVQHMSETKHIGPIISIVQLILTTFGLGLIAWISDIEIDHILAFGLSSTLLGFLVCNFTTAKFFFGSSILFAGGGSLCMLAMRLLDQAPALAPAIILLGFILFTASAASQIHLKSIMVFLIPNSIKIAVFAVIPLMLSIIAAIIATEFEIK
jgi:hypothetical protein